MYNIFRVIKNAGPYNTLVFNLNNKQPKPQCVVYEQLLIELI